MIVDWLRRFNIWMHKKWAYPNEDKKIADNMKDYWMHQADGAEK